MKRFCPLPVLCLTLALALLQVSAAADKNYFYSQLDASGQEIYSHLLQSVDALRSGTPVSITKSGMDRVSASRYMQSSANAVKALNRDHPEIFWLNDWRTEAGGMGNDYTFTLNFNFGDSWSPVYGNRSISDDESAMNSQIAALAAQARAAGSSRYDQLAFVHDWLTHNNLYNSYAAGLGSPVGDSSPWEAISALDTSLSPVCEGYARAFKLICDELGIPCVLASGRDHMWNCVQMEDGAWYAVDVTYDDPVYSYNGVTQDKLESGGESRKYFLVGAQSLQDHTYDRDWSYPTLSAADYKAGSAPSAPEPEPVTPDAPEIPTEPENPTEPETPIAPEMPAEPETSTTPTPPETPTPAPAEPDTDAAVATASNWAREEVGAAIRSGLVPPALRSGYQDQITRADFARLAVILVERITGSSADSLLDSLGREAAVPFRDTSDPYVLAAYSLKIVNGRTKAAFDPNGGITRQEAAAMLARAAKILGAPVNGNAKNFKDSGEFASWAAEAIAYVSSVRAPETNKPVMGGVGGKRFDPMGTYTREQAYITAFRLFQALGGAEGMG